jgi:hypothetical protein
LIKPAAPELQSLRSVESQNNNKALNEKPVLFRLSAIHKMSKESHDAPRIRAGLAEDTMPVGRKYLTCPVG